MKLNRCFYIFFCLSLAVLFGGCGKSKEVQETLEKEEQVRQENVENTQAPQAQESQSQETQTQAEDADDVPYIVLDEKHDYDIIATKHFQNVKSIRLDFGIDIACKDFDVRESRITIKAGAFQNCSQLQQIILDGFCYNNFEIEKGAFDGCNKELVVYCDKQLYPDLWKQFSEWGLQCKDAADMKSESGDIDSRLQEMTGLTTDGYYAMDGNGRLLGYSESIFAEKKTGKAESTVMRVPLPEETVSIGSGIFNNHTANTIVIPAGVEEIEDSVFSSMAFLKKVKFAGNKLKKIGKGAFAANVAIRKMEFPDGLEEIESGNIVAKKVILPASVKRAGLDLGPAVKKIYVYGKDTEFYEDNVLSYEQSGIEIFCQKGSKAEKFFREKGGFKIKYIR